MPKPQTFSFTAAPIPEFYLPQITRGPSSVTAKRNGIVTLTCAVDGWPKPTVTWYRDDTRLNPIALSALAQFTPDLIRLEVAENLPKLLNSIQFGKTIKFPTGPDVTVLGSHGYASTRHGSLVLLGVTESEFASC